MKMKYWLLIGGAVLAGIAVYEILKEATGELEAEPKNEELDEKIAKWGVGS